MCLQCNLTIHTKYCRTETDPKFNPSVNLICNDKIVIVTNGLIHMLEVGLDLNRPIKTLTNSIDIKYIRPTIRTDKSIASNSGESTDPVAMPAENVITDETMMLSTPLEIICPENGNQLPERSSSLCNVSMNREMNGATTPANHHTHATKSENIVARIIADFAECETEFPSNDKIFPRPNTSSNFNELVITCGSSNAPSDSNSSNKVRLLNHRSNRIISKSINSIKNGITKVDLHMSTQMNASKNLDKAAKAYEFSEDNEKCEKISIFRKRRLADKKYEFSEDNSENIIPYPTYNKLRSAIRNFPPHTKIPKSSPGHSSCISSASPTNFEMHSPHHTHRASPSCGFRSPCGSPVGNRFMMMSPPGK